MDAHLIVEHQGPVATLVLHRPDRRNAVDHGMWRRLPALLDALAADAAVRVLVVRGAGDQAFSGGADLEELATLREDPAAARAYVEATQAAERALASFPWPTIAMVHGACVGGGAELALACDLRFADTAARFGVPPARLGLVYGLRATRRLVALAGPALARELLFTGDLIDAPRAHAAGLFDRLEAPADLEPATRAFAERVATRSPAALRAAKAFLGRIGDGQRDDDEATMALRAAAFAGDDFAEGVRAFRDKRAPRFG